MAFEYQMLVYMTLFFLVAWFPQSVAKKQTYGMKWLMGNRKPIARELPEWGNRAGRAYENLKDYFPGFVVAILLLGQLNKFDQSTAIAAAVYVLARVIHLVGYIAGSFNFRFFSYLTAMIANFFLLAKALA